MCMTIHHTARSAEMRTNIELDDDLVEEARRLTGITTKRALVEEALKVLISSRSRRSLLDLKGKISFAEGYDYHSLREDRL
jgi:Arc/MetJ family transcription regulator